MSDRASELQVIQDRIRTLRMDEDEAIIGYLEVLSETDDPQIKEVLSDIVREEKVHIGQLDALLNIFDPENAQATKEGIEEGVEQMSDVDAWNDLKKNLKVKKTNYPNQVSMPDKMDVVLAELGDIKTSVERLDDVVPELASDYNAIEQESEDMEEIGMTEEPDGLMFNEDFEEVDATNEVSTEEEVDTEPLDTSEVGEQDELPEAGDTSDGEDIDTDEDILDGEVGEEDEIEKSLKGIVVSKKGFEQLLKVTKELADKVQRLESSNRILKSKVASLRVAQHGNTLAKSQSQPKERVIKRGQATPQSVAKSTGRMMVSNKPPMGASYRGGDPNALHKAMNSVNEPLPNMGMGADGNDIAKRLAGKIDAIASGQRQVL